MDIQKIELLIKKVYQAIKTIEKLKENEKRYLNEISVLKDANIKLQEENIFLKKEREVLLSEIKKNDNITKELEQKIVDILKYLPDDENSEDSVKNIVLEEDNKSQGKIQNNSINNKILNNNESEKEEVELKEEKEDKNIFNESLVDEEEMLKKFINSGSKNLFGNKKDEKEKKEGLEKIIEDENKDTSIFDTNIYSDKDIDDSKKIINNKIDFEETLIDDEEKEDINFNFDDFPENNSGNGNNDLPKGVL